MALATLSIDVEARLAGLEAGLDKAGRLAEKSSAQIEASFNKLRTAGAAIGGVLTGAAAALGGGGFARLVIGVNAGVNALKDLKEATGDSIENISALEDVGARTGTSFEGVGSILLKFNKALADASTNKEIAQTFRNLGLDAEKLKQIDPAEALRQTAVAMAGFADSGAKGRAIMELFGKSAAEAGPFLSNLAEQGKLVATVTTQQALEAEKFNNQLEALKKNATDAARGLTAELVPALNKFFERLNGLQQAGGFFSSIGKELDANLISDRLRVVTEEIIRLDAYMQKNPGNAKLQIAMKQLRDEAAQLSKQALAASASLKGFSDVALPFEDPANYGNEGRRGAKPILAETKGKPFTTKQESELNKYVRKLIEAQQATLDLSNEEQARLDIATGKLGKLNALQTQQVLDLARGLDILKAVPELVGPKIDEATLQARDAAQKNLERLLADTLPARLAELRDLSDALNRSIAEGTITEEQHAAGVAELAKRYEDLGPKIEETTKKIDEFTAQAARNIQDALGDTVLKTLEGDFDNIAELWANMIKRMLAEAAGAQIGKALLGDYGKSGELGGLFGDIVKAIGGGGAGSNYSNEGRNYPAPIVGTQAAGGRAGALSARGGGMVINSTVHVGAGVSRGEVSAAVAQGNRALVEQLQAAGRL